MEVTAATAPDDTVVDSDMPVFVISDSDSDEYKSQLFTQALCCDSSSNGANAMWWHYHMEHCF